MAEVDPADDTISRWVIHHYMFDPQRNQRRNVLVGAYDNEAEFQAALQDRTDRLRAETASDGRDTAERVSGVVWPPGHHAMQARGRLLSQATAHGVDPRRVPLDGPLPSNVSFFGWDADGTAWSLGGDDPAEPRGNETAVRPGDSPG